MISSQQSSCPPVEWPQASSTVTLQLGDTDKKNENMGSSSTSFDDMDPFANWPPRPTSFLSGSGSSNNGTIGPPTNKFGSDLNTVSANGLNFQTNINNSWAFDTQTSIVPLRQNQGSATLNGSINPQNSIGFLKQNQGISALGTPYNDKKTTDLGSIFVSSKNEHPAPKTSSAPTNCCG
ncbi:hypothetical protein L1049_026937 [Liquidambar formosana]|uniref:Uncharacterized protein n=1 Tax=Liquidambar formosana TaxID=63359 RepID=A0AAP0R610_LIQFO